jgi:hypothetical protein
LVVQSEARWEGEVEVEGIRAKLAFEVFDSGGKWDFLFGKSLLETFKAIHNYERDEIILKETNKTATLYNQSHIMHSQTKHPESPICVVTGETQQPEDDNQPMEVDMDAFQGDGSLFTRMTDPFKCERVQEVHCGRTLAQKNDKKCSTSWSHSRTYLPCQSTKSKQ